LDLYEGQFDFNNFSTQRHDFDPGITPYPEGLFWTVQIANSAVAEVDVADGRARYAVHEMHMSDFFNLPNALFHLMDPVSIPATTSFDVRWSGPVTKKQTIHDAKLGFSGEFVSCSATMKWSAKTSIFKFESGPASSSHSTIALLGHERNGVFFSGED
jgi:hypothetical protein